MESINTKNTNITYHIICGIHSTFVKNINDALRQNWHLYGDTTCVVKNNSLIYSQAIIKYN